MCKFSFWRIDDLLILLNSAFYGVSLNNPIILTTIGFAGGSTVYKQLLNTAVGNLIIVLAGAIPSYWITVATVDTIGRKPIQFGGFFILVSLYISHSPFSRIHNLTILKTVLFCILGFAYDKLSNHAVLALYVIAQFFFNFGPNATTFIIPGECFPTRYRSNSHGFSAASGKIGAIIAQAAIAPLRVTGVQKGATGRAAAP